MDEEEFAECIRSATDSLKRIADALSKDAEMASYHSLQKQKHKIDEDVFKSYLRRVKEQHGRCEDDD